MRLTPAHIEALDLFDALANDPELHFGMQLQPGDMQFINNYHVLHGRTSYEDDRAAGKIRHLKRLWLETEVLAERPPQFVNRMGSHWARTLTVSRMDAGK